jgi:hypothetical protein
MVEQWVVNVAEIDEAPLLDVAAAASVPVAVLRQAAKRGLINAWTRDGIEYVSPAEATVYLQHRPDIIPLLSEPWATASQVIRDRYAGAYWRLR